MAPLLGIGLLSGLATGGFVLVALAALDLPTPSSDRDAVALVPPGAVTSWALGPTKAPSAPISPMVDGGIPQLAAAPASTAPVSPPPAAATAVPVSPADIPPPSGPELDDLAIDDAGPLFAAGTPTDAPDEAAGPEVPGAEPLPEADVDGVPPQHSRPGGSGPQGSGPQRPGPQGPEPEGTRPETRPETTGSPAPGPRVTRPEAARTQGNPPEGEDVFEAVRAALRDVLALVVAPSPPAPAGDVAGSGTTPHR